MHLDGRILGVALGSTFQRAIFPDNFYEFEFTCILICEAISTEGNYIDIYKYSNVTFLALNGLSRYIFFEMAVYLNNVLENDFNLAC